MCVLTELGLRGVCEIQQFHVLEGGGEVDSVGLQQLLAGEELNRLGA